MFQPSENYSTLLADCLMEKVNKQCLLFKYSMICNVTLFVGIQLDSKIAQNRRFFYFTNLYFTNFVYLA